MSFLMEQWQNLRNQIEVIINEEVRIPTDSELSEFEAQTGILLPVGYKEFCQTFGAGTFGSFVDLGPPYLDFSKECLGFIKDALEREVEAEDADLEEISRILSLLDSAFIFGGTCNSQSFLWDLRTYSERDQSYDIYLMGIYVTNPCWVGRDFFEFVIDFCLGTQSHELLPEGLRPSPEEIYPTFTQF